MVTNNPLGRDPAESGAPHIPPQSEIGSVGGGGARRKGGHVGIPLGDGDVEVLEVVAESAPRWVPPNKGLSKYPFDRVPVGGGMRIRRGIGTVKSAVRGWVKRHKGQKFSVWKKPDGWVMVKRIK